MFRPATTLVCLFLLIACGRNPTTEEISELGPYFERFEAASAQFGRDTSGDHRVILLFGGLKNGEIGVCEQSPLHSPRVLVDRATWLAHSDDGREAMIFHELGHCLLGRDHKDDLTTMRSPLGDRALQTPASLMHSRGVRATTYASDRNYYLKELFSSP